MAANTAENLGPRSSSDTQAETKQSCRAQAFKKRQLAILDQQHFQHRYMNEV